MRSQVSEREKNRSRTVVSNAHRPGHRRARRTRACRPGVMPLARPEGHISSAEFNHVRRAAFKCLSLCAYTSGRGDRHLFDQTPPCRPTGYRLSTAGAPGEGYAARARPRFPS